MADDINDVLQTVFAITLAIVTVASYGKNLPLSRKYRTFLITLAIATATQAAVVLLARAFGEQTPTWQRSLMIASLGTLTIAMILAVLAARTRARALQPQDPQEEQAEQAEQA